MPQTELNAADVTCELLKLEMRERKIDIQSEYLMWTQSTKQLLQEPVFLHRALPVEQQDVNLSRFMALISMINTPRSIHLPETTLCKTPR